MSSNAIARFRKLFIPLVFIVVALVEPGCSRRHDSASTNKRPNTTATTSDAFFQPGPPRELRIEISNASIDKIKQDHRPYVRADLVESNSKRLANVGIKIKGAAGSTRDFEDKPALTVRADKFAKEQDFHGLAKFHLNNSVQDGTYMHEWLGAKIYTDAGYPATRVTHGRLHLNDRDVGLYVIKEGFDTPFLTRHFARPDGNLYDGGFIQDLDAELEKDSGNGPNDFSDLHAVVDACRAPIPKERWQRMEERIDIERLLTFMAIERMLAHWDGYTLQSNNYRLYFDPQSNKAVFLPHGMDQIFGDTEMSVFGHAGPMVSAAIVQNNAWRSRYRDRVRALLPLFHPDRLIPEMERFAKPVTTKLQMISAELAEEHRQGIEDLRNRIRARYDSLVEQLEQPEPVPIPFDENAFAILNDWNQASEVEDAKHMEYEGPPQATLEIESGDGETCVASWRHAVLLGPGQYRFHATLSCFDVVTQEDGPELVGAGIRISGGERPEALAGTRQDVPMHMDFEVLEDQREVELVVELRCKSGRLVVNKDSLRLEYRSR